jgi:hypothetical protein
MMPLFITGLAYGDGTEEHVHASSAFCVRPLECAVDGLVVLPGSSPVQLTLNTAVSVLRT